MEDISKHAERSKCPPNTTETKINFLKLWNLLNSSLSFPLLSLQTVFALLIEMLKSSLWSTSPKSD